MTNRRFYIWIVLIALVLSFGVIMILYQNFKSSQTGPAADDYGTAVLDQEDPPDETGSYPSNTIFNPIDENNLENIPQKETFLVKEVEGRVLVYSEGGETFLFCAEEIDLYALPESDREMLRTGILLPSLEALARLLEDYSS